MRHEEAMRGGNVCEVRSSAFSMEGERMWEGTTGFGWVGQGVWWGMKVCNDNRGLDSGGWCKVAKCACISVEQGFHCLSWAAVAPTYMSTSPGIRYAWLERFL